jgi:hypothetical protein
VHGSGQVVSISGMYGSVRTCVHVAPIQDGVKYCGRSRGAKALSEAKIKLSHKRLMLICYNLDPSWRRGNWLQTQSKK